MKLDSAISYKQQREQRNQREPKGKPDANKKTEPPVEPTPEQKSKSDFYRPSLAHRKTPVIDTMLKREQITVFEHRALSFYRDQAIAADKSPIKSNIDFAVRSGNQRPIGYATPQQIETARIERDLGQLQPIARAIAVNDYSISEWCIEKHGGRERMQGKRVIIVPKTDRHTELAVQDLRMAAHRITT